MPALVYLHPGRCRAETGLTPADVATLAAIHSYERVADSLTGCVLSAPRKELSAFCERHGFDALFSVHTLKDAGFIERRETAFGAGYATTDAGRKKLAELTLLPVLGAAE